MSIFLKIVIILMAKSFTVQVSQMETFDIFFNVVFLNFDLLIFELFFYCG